MIFSYYRIQFFIIFSNKNIKKIFRINRIKNEPTHPPLLLLELIRTKNFLNIKDDDRKKPIVPYSIKITYIK